MARVTGIGGVFLRSRDPKALTKWYSETLGIELNDWGGIVFEFGLIGAFLILALLVRGVIESRSISNTPEAAFLGALQDYLIYVIVISPMYPPTLSPGEYAMILAIIVHEQTRIGSGDPRFSNRRFAHA